MTWIDFSFLAEFSRDRCIAICAFLVPANLLLTVQTLSLVARNRSQAKIRLSVAIATVLAAILVLHVGTWFAIGVVTPVTFILLGLASTCLALSFWTAIYQSTFRDLLQVGQTYLYKTVLAMRSVLPLPPQSQNNVNPNRQ
ncbi:MAG: hypothetical protein MUD14_24510 [Hydrococcus sp. Prado102]|nr:hypothetical protein [Hydrococcus sp. Prado102]